MEYRPKKSVAIIPARGGSKRIPRKNIIDFKGKPMIAWTIEAALKTKLFDKVIVSTESIEIKQISIDYGAEVPFFREVNSDDYSPVSLATLEALIQSENYFGEKYNHIVQLMANCPIRNYKSILKQYSEFVKLGGDFSLISAFSYGMYNPFWAHEITAEGKSNKLFGNKYDNVRSQDLPNLLCPTGAIWISSREKLIEEKTFYSSNYRLSEMPWIQAIDIDDIDDLKLANIAYDYEKL